MSKLTLQALAEQVESLQRALISQPRLHIKDVALRYGVSVMTLYRWIRRGRLPRPIRFTGPLWRLEDLEKAEAAGRIPGPH